MGSGEDVIRPLWALVAKGDFDGALSYLEGLGPADAEPWWIAYHLGKVHEYRQEWDQALRHFEEAARLAPTNPAVWHGMGWALQSLRRHDEALDALGRALQLRPDYMEAWQSLGITLLEAGDPDGAAGAFQAALAHLARQGRGAAGLPVPPLLDTPTGLPPDDPALTGGGHVLEEPVAAHLIRDGRFAKVLYHLALAHLAADRHLVAQEAFGNALKMGLDGVERANAATWLAEYAAGRVTRRLN